MGHDDCFWCSGRRGVVRCVVGGLVDIWMRISVWTPVGRRA